MNRSVVVLVLFALAAPATAHGSTRTPDCRNGVDDDRHVSINARNLEESVEFYVDLLRAEPIATPNFGVSVQWLALGRTQLHIFQADMQPTSHHHFGVTVQDLEPVYRAAERRDAFERQAFRNHLVELLATPTRGIAA